MVSTDDGCESEQTYSIPLRLAIEDNIYKFSLAVINLPLSTKYQIRKS